MKNDWFVDWTVNGYWLWLNIPKYDCKPEQIVKIGVWLDVGNVQAAPLGREYDKVVVVIWVGIYKIFNCAAYLILFWVKLIKYDGWELAKINNLLDKQQQYCMKAFKSE